jgi:general secretion pathway protein C
VNRYSPLLELLAVFSIGAVARAVDSPPAVHHPPRAHRAIPTLEQPPAQLDLGQMARLTRLPDRPTEPPIIEPACTLSANLNDIAMQARIVPAFRDGVAVGFKLFSIRPDSIYAAFGIQNGDVIRNINGLDLNSPEKALEIYSKLKETCRFDIGLERDGKWVHLLGTLPKCPDK